MRILTRKNIIIFSFATVLLIIYLIFANNIVLRLFTDNPIIERANKEDYLRTTRGFSNVRFNMRNDMFDSFVVDGWAFAEADYQDNKVVSLVLRGMNNDQIFSAPMSLRRDSRLPRHFADSDIRIADYMHRITGEFSSVPLPIDIYEIYLHSKENENEAGWIRTGLRFEINSNGLTAFNPQSQNFTDVPTYDGWTHGLVDSFHIVDNLLTISGWIFRYGCDTLFQTIWVELTNADGDIATFLATNVIRDDVANLFYEPLYRYSGYHAVIPLDVLYNCESLTLAFITENDGVFYRHELP